MAARALKPRQPWTKAQLLAAGGVMVYSGHRARKSLKEAKKKEEEKNAFFVGFAEEMGKLAAKTSSAKLKALQMALAGVGLGVVGGVTEGVVNPLTESYMKHRKKKRKAAHEKAAFFLGFTGEQAKLGFNGEGGHIPRSGELSIKHPAVGRSLYKELVGAGAIKKPGIFSRMKKLVRR